MPSLRISIPKAHTESIDGKDVTTYEIRIEHPFPRGTSTLRKRYSDFAALDAALRSQVGAAPPAPLPPKSWLGSGLGKLGFSSTAGSPELVERRRAGLEAYLQAIETGDDGRWRVAKAYRNFLDVADVSRKTASFPGSQFGKDRVQDSTDWLDKYAEVKSCLQDARRWLTRREQATAATAQHEAGANAKRSLVRAGSLLSALDEGLTRLGSAQGGDWGGEKLGEGEVRRRRDLLGTARKERDGLESVLNAMAVKTAVAGGSGVTPPSSSAAASTEQKAGLFSRTNTGPGTGRRVLGGPPAQETERTRELDNEGVLQLQRQIIEEQDQDLVDLTTVVKRMREMGVRINEEIVEQNAMLGLLGDDVERVEGKMQVAKKKIARIR